MHPMQSSGLLVHTSMAFTVAFRRNVGTFPAALVCECVMAAEGLAFAALSLLPKVQSMPHSGTSTTIQVAEPCAAPFLWK